MVPILHLTSSIVDALLLLLDPLGVLAAEIGESGRHLSHLGLRYLVVIIRGEGNGVPKARTRAIAKAFIMGKILQARVTYREKLPGNSFRYSMEINTSYLEMNCALLGIMAE